MNEIAPLQVEVANDRLVGFMGGVDLSLSQRTKRAIVKAMEVLNDLAAPKAAFKLFPVHIEGDSVHLNGECRLKSKRLAKVFGPCEYAVVFAATLGPKMDEAIQEFMGKRIYFGVVLDAAASAAAESLTQQLQASIEEALPQNAGTTLCYSPGYCDWPLQDQEKLFKLLPEHPAGIELTKECLMSPRKSISGIMGIGPTDIVSNFGNACIECPRLDCPHRRKS